MKKLKIGILGCANIAKNQFIPALLELQDKFEIVGVASRSGDKAKEFATLFGISPIVGYEELLNIDLDAVYIPLPTGLHKKWVNLFLAKGVHVYAEKSLAFSSYDVEEMLENARKSNVALMEGYTFLYHPQHSFVKQLIQEGEIGEIRSFDSNFGFPPLLNTNFRYQAEIGGGVLFDACGYTLKSAFYFLGETVELKASSLNFNKDFQTETIGSAFLAKNGVSAHLTFGFDNFYQCNYVIWGSKGKITVNKAFTPRAHQETVILIEKDSEIREINIPPANQFVLALNEFYNLVFDFDKRQSHYSDMLRVSKTIDQIITMKD
jgi:NDP-hexose-3-ketoreductase